MGADSLGYLSVEGLMKVVGGTNGGFCDACFTGEYPTQLTDHDGGDETAQLSLLAELA